MDLGDWRSRISDLDNQILALLNQRAEAALQIGDLKRRQDAPSYVPEREAAILDRLAEASRGPLSAPGGDRGVARDPVGLPRTRIAADRRLSGAPGYVHAPGRARAASANPSSITARATIAERLRGRRARPRALRRGPSGELHRRRRQRHARSPGRHRAADLRRADAGDRPAPAVAGAGPRRDQARAVAPPGTRPVPAAGWPPTCATCRWRRPRPPRPPPSWPPPTPPSPPSPPIWPAASTTCRCCGRTSRTTARTPRASSSWAARPRGRAADATRPRSSSRSPTSPGALYRILEPLAREDELDQDRVPAGATRADVGLR